MCKRVVGVHNGHNSSAALVQDGLLSFALQEERLTRVKNQGGLPKLTLQRIASDFPVTDPAGEGLPVAFGGRNLTACDWQRDAILQSYGQRSSGPVVSLKRLARRSAFVSDSINLVNFCNLESELRTILPREHPEAMGFDHHLSHAAAAYFGWGKMEEKVLVLTCDGAGDCACASVSIGERGMLKTIARTEESHSVGAFFGKITYLLGMVPMEHEYKVMGLAPYAENTREAKSLADEFSRMFEFDPHNLMIWRRKNGSPAMQFAADYLADHIQRKRFDHVAAGAQLFIEQFLASWVENCVRLTGIPRVALSGGVFMNVKANKRILELDEVDELFVFPSCGDETNAIGAAWLRYHEMYKETPQPLEHLYLGTACTEHEIEQAIKNYEFTSAISVKEMPDIEREVAELLAGNKIVARFKGRCEFGARALGNRSILANASDTQAVRTINSMIKCRDFWMPFAPSVLAERSKDYFRKPKPMPAPHMIMTFDTCEEKRSAISAAIHPQDFTARPQEVFEATNASYYKLIKHFEELTGEGLILNTSYNLHGEPVVCTAEDALRVFDISGLEYLAMENVLLKKA